MASLVLVADVADDEHVDRMSTKPVAKPETCAKSAAQMQKVRVSLAIFVATVLHAVAQINHVVNLSAV